MLKLSFDEIIIGYFGFVAPLFFLKTAHEALIISFYVFFWTLTLYLWSNWIKQ